MSARDDDEDALVSLEWLVEQAVLQRVLFAQPVRVSMDDLARAAMDRLGPSATREEVETAVCCLEAVGLLRRDGEWAYATRAAVRFEDLGS